MPSTVPGGAFARAIGHVDLVAPGNTVRAPVFEDRETGKARGRGDESAGDLRPNFAKKCGASRSDTARGPRRQNLLTHLPMGATSLHTMMWTRREMLLATCTLMPSVGTGCKQVIPSVDDVMARYFSEQVLADRPSIRLRDLLTMRSGSCSCASSRQANHE